MLVQCLARHASLDGHIHVLDIDAQNPIHLRQIDADAALQRRDMPLERGAGAESDNGRLSARAERNDLGDLLCAVCERDGVRRVRGMIGLVLAVLRAHRGGCRKAVAEQLPQRGEERLVGRHASENG